ncbi:DUF4382 domain-containing protein [Thiohalorhabdus sp.]|uniref:DUF4382 domain-containing protein n=1 Tax=Thiohalorhabdus sp. TaxID=3094134 RepID=UPI002FC2A4F5
MENLIAPIGPTMSGFSVPVFLRTAAATALFGSVLALPGCGSSDGGNDGATTGTLSLGVTDAPVDEADKVVVRFDAVEIKPADGESRTFTFDSAQSIDLLAQQGENSASLLVSEEVAAGDYNWIRLHITANQSPTDSYIDIAASRHSLFIPSAKNTGLKLVRGFTVPANGTADFTVDFDLRKSLVKPGQSGNHYILKPAMRLVDNSEVGHIATDVTIITTCHTPAIYVFDAVEVTPDDLDTGTDQDTDPVTTANLADADGDGTHTSTAGFLTAGTYTVAFTCEAANDVSDANDNLAFEGAKDVEVQAHQTATYSHSVQ